MFIPDTSIIVSRSARTIVDMLQFSMSLVFKKPYYSGEEYEGFKEFYKKLFDLLNEQFVIKKKAKP